RNTLILEWNNTRADYPRDRCLHELFEAQAAISSKAPAMMFGADSISYEQLDKKSTLLAKYLQRQGIGPNSLVAIYMERSLDLMVALLGTMKAGGAYIPLDPAYPKERLSYILEDSQAGIVLTQSMFDEEVRDLCASQTKGPNADPARLFVHLDEHWS